MVVTCRTALALSLLSAACMAACAPPPEPKTAKSEDTEEVPANSGTDPDVQTAKEAKKDEGPKEAKTEPLTTPLAQTDDADGDKPAAGAKKKPNRGGPRATKAQCSAAFDKYLDLAIGSDARLAGVTPELIRQAKEQARGMKGDPCSGNPPSKSQYDCAMGAATTSEWETCMK
ncbi:MAG: hypothetical protein KC657_21475 [Myxococcales bacterium]|nr:hypothetical protein [Myxococcales bacterium]